MLVVSAHQTTRSPFCVSPTSRSDGSVSSRYSRQRRYRSIPDLSFMPSPGRPGGRAYSKGTPSANAAAPRQRQWACAWATAPPSPAWRPPMPSFWRRAGCTLRGMTGSSVARHGAFRGSRPRVLPGRRRAGPAPVVRDAREEMGRGAAGRQRPPRRDGVRRPSARAAADQRRHAVVGRTGRLGHARREGRLPRCGAALAGRYAAADAVAQRMRGLHAVLPAARRPGLTFDVPGSSRLPPRAAPRRRDRDVDFPRRRCRIRAR